MPLRPIRYWTVAAGEYLNHCDESYPNGIPDEAGNERRPRFGVYCTSGLRILPTGSGPAG